MSRGGRGAFRGGARIGGLAEVPWVIDPDIKGDFKPSELFPVVEQPKPTPLSRTERLQVGRYRAFRDRVHEGPLYTVLGDNHRVAKQGSSHGGSNNNSALLVDPFEGMPTYSQKYRKKTRRLPRLDTRPYVMEFFPKELWSTLDPDYEKQHGTATTTTTTTVGRNQTTKKKILKLSRPDDLERDLLDEDFREDEDVEEQPDGGKGRPTKGVGGDGDEPPEKRLDGEGEGDEELGDEEEQDDDFEDAEEEMAADYNAEDYFEDGGDDNGDDYGDMGGGDDDAYY
ncbi:MAG: hypothetical protein M1816_007552 [Peltula sp. TS41687]|nr:MAG: hypothetical protein M1816_007552 [Peltula sp. TS41687]